MDADHDSVLQRSRGLEKRVWMAVGGLAVITFGARVFASIPNILTNIAEPPNIERSY